MDHFDSGLVISQACSSISPQSFGVDPAFPGIPIALNEISIKRSNSWVNIPDICVVELNDIQQIIYNQETINIDDIESFRSSLYQEFREQSVLEMEQNKHFRLPRWEVFTHDIPEAVIEEYREGLSERNRALVLKKDSRVEAIIDAKHQAKETVSNIPSRRCILDAQLFGAESAYIVSLDYSKPTGNTQLLQSRQLLYPEIFKTSKLCLYKLMEYAAPPVLPRSEFFKRYVRQNKRGELELSYAKHDAEG